MTSWDIVTKSKNGGLGVQRSRERNLALLGSLAWMANSGEKPWARLLRAKYATTTINARGCLMNARRLSNYNEGS